MKLFKCLLLLGLLLMLSCAKPQKQEKPLLLATIHPYELLLKQLAGSEFEVQCIIPAGASPHTWSPGPSNLEAFGKAAFILANGLGLEANLDKNLATRSSITVEAAALLKDVIPLSEPSPDEHAEEPVTATGEEEHHHGQDPHLWTSPQLMSRLTEMVTKELSVRFPNSALLFQHNAEQISKELNSLSDQIQSEKADYVQPAIVTYHNSFGYFCQFSGVKNLGWVQASPGKEPTPKELSELGKLIQTHQIKAIFLEPQMNRKAGEVLAREFRLKLLTLDPLGSDGKATTLAELIRNNWDNMKQGFTRK